MMHFLDEWLILLAVQMMGLMSPGPDFVMTVRNSVIYSRRAGFFTALGLAGGVGIHASYCVFGIAILISQSILLFSLIKYVGAGYLIYIGVKALRSQGFEGHINTAQKSRAVSDLAALRSGFITNLLNPKATVFFLALFTQLISPETPAFMLFLYALTCVVTTVLWFGFVAFVLSSGPVRGKFLRFSKLVERVCGGLLIALGVKLALTKGLQGS